MLKRFMVVLAVCGVCQSAYGLEFQAVGNGALGVGGAGVARTSGAMAPYWNPAGLAFADKTVSVSVAGGVGLMPGKKLTEDLSTVSDAYNAWNKNKTSSSAELSLISSINGISNTDNLLATADGAVGIQIKHFGLGVFGTFEGGATPTITPISTSLPLPNESTLKTDLAQSRVNPRGILLLEAPLSYGHDLDLGDYGHLGLGLTLKYLYGETTSATQSIYNSSSDSILSSSDLTKQLSKNRSGKSNFGIDLGALWKPGKMVPVPLSVGLVGKNLNAPSFTDKSGNKIPVDPQVRAGIAISPLTWLDLTGDIDVIKNTTVVSGLRSQQLGGGAEFKPVSSLKLRVGGYTDLAQSTGAVTAGFSVGIPWIYIDIDGAYGLGSVKYDGKSYPSEAKVEFSLNFAY
ncbi:conjugal transfer protein TraF [Oryzomonas rubra]|nr:conjugal transfer protein TraF [Oryzomonas rubra]